MPIYEPKREEEVLRNIAEHNAGPLPQEAAQRIFERIIDEMRTLQRMRMDRRGMERGNRLSEEHRQECLFHGDD